MSFPVGYMEPPELHSAVGTEWRSCVTLTRLINDRSLSMCAIRTTLEATFGSAVNIPEDSFMDDDDVDALVAKYKDEDAVVFHCMMSQVRGPSCAKRFKARMEVVLEGAAHKPRVLILHGGYERFGSMYKNEADLIEMDA
uniref:Rhodanese domain-containing protein n=1 Tax=Peronospora matthiolae TaxID=2874970 RepID=A0AAV1UUD3_9STRA